MKKYGYDAACEALAAHFLKDHPHRHTEDLHELAQSLQDAVEDYMRGVDAREPQRAA